MKYDQPQKITALGVVIFSFASLLICFLIIMLLDSLAAFLVLKTAMPESIMKVWSVISSGIGIIFSTTILTVKAKLKGIFSAGIIGSGIILIKIIGNSILHLGSYLNWWGFVGMLFVAVFALIGGVLGSSLKR